MVCHLKRRWTQVQFLDGFGSEWQAYTKPAWTSVWFWRLGSKSLPNLVVLSSERPWQIHFAASLVISVVWKRWIPHCKASLLRKTLSKPADYAVFPEFSVKARRLRRKSSGCPAVCWKTWRMWFWCAATQRMSLLVLDLLDSPLSPYLSLAFFSFTR